MIIESNSTLDAINNFDSQEERFFKNSFYASNLGLECPKRQWLTFINAFQDKVSNRVKRLFDRGNREEQFIIGVLRSIGIEVISPYESEKTQFTVEYLNGHIRGKIDAIALKGVKEAAHKLHVLEFKTMNDSSFKDMQKNGLEMSQPTHFVQIQAYMNAKDMDRGLYIAVNKNNDELYVERVKLNKTYMKDILNKAANIILNKNSMPPALSNDKTFFKCKMCNASDVCHGEVMPEINCRTCVFSEAKDDGKFYCNYWLKKSAADKPIPLDAQKLGCGNHIFIPQLLKKLYLTSVNTETNLTENMENPNEHYFLWHFDTHYIRLSLTNGYNSKQIKELGYGGLLDLNIAKMSRTTSPMATSELSVLLF